MCVDRLFRLAVLAVALLVLPARAHVGEQVFPIYELPTSALPDLHDGSLDDWKAVLPAPSLDSSEFPGLAAFDEGLGQASLSFRVWLAWHHPGQRLYLAVEWIDDVFWSSYAGLAGPSWRGSSDGFDVMVDGDHSGGQYFPTRFMFGMSDVFTGSKRLITCVQAQRYSVVFRAADGSNAGLYGPLKDLWTNHPPYIDAGGFASESPPARAGVEMTLPAWDHLDIGGVAQSVASRLVPGGIIGLDLIMWDWDGAMALARPYMLNGFADITQASGFKDGLLVPCDQEDCSGSSGGSFVRSDSWARVKANLR